jgi:hypothetical protein
MKTHFEQYDAKGTNLGTGTGSDWFLPPNIELYEVNGQTVFPLYNDEGELSTSLAFWLVDWTTKRAAGIKVRLDGSTSSIYGAITQKQVNSALLRMVPFDELLPKPE